MARRLAGAAACIGLIAAGCGDDASEPDNGDKTMQDAAVETPQDGGGGRLDAAQAPPSDAGGVAHDAATGGGQDSATGGGSDAGSGRDAGGSEDAGGSDAGSGAKPRFSFFMTSQAGLERLAGNSKGFGGNLRFGKADGLSGADEICKQLAEASMPGNGKTWRAFLSVTKGPNGMPVHAIDRIGEGPWYDRRERIFAMNKAALMSPRPLGADPVIVDDFPNEDGVPNHDPGTGIIDNHNTLTGSNTMGQIHSGGLSSTCQDWTSSEADGGRPQCGVSWPRRGGGGGWLEIVHWISALPEGGCAPGTTPPGAEAGPRGTVGALGGYGGFYCFALTP